MASVSATSLKLFSSTSQASWRSSSLRALSVRWTNTSFPSLRTSRFRISCAAKPETVQKVCEIVRKQLALPPESELTPETKFSALGADSLDTIGLVVMAGGNSDGFGGRV
ncbi:acyl carrier protein 1, chloroplastic isoform X2 [Prosopis cineraria]|uniref:acyl carrier protein 1, chloroplastic isoform X2 n=1 Tax=Prosopis cineraria TaxID=364024 RepID=UPI00240EE937|nr:acyl carrier protein 1, chloroplastic isoform X2 [Prosopis cineraria]